MNSSGFCENNFHPDSIAMLAVRSLISTTKRAGLYGRDKVEIKIKSVPCRTWKSFPGSRHVWAINCNFLPRRLRAAVIKYKKLGALLCEETCNLAHRGSNCIASLQYGNPWARRPVPASEIFGKDRVRPCDNRERAKALRSLSPRYRDATSFF